MSPVPFTYAFATLSSSHSSRIGLLLPLVVVEIPPVLDYPNHLARMWLLSMSQPDPILSRMYAPDWHLIPNLAIDAIVPTALHFLPLHVAGRLALGATLLLPVIGTVALHRALHRHWSLWPLGSCLIAYNVAFFLGFMNFLIGLGVSLLIAAAWTRLRPKRPLLAVAVLALGAIVTFFCHVVPLLLLGLMVVSTQAELVFTRRAASIWRMVMRDCAECAVGFSIPVYLYLASAFGTGSDRILYQPLKVKLMEAVSPVLTYDLPLDASAGAAILVATAWFLLWRRDKTVLPLRIGITIAALVLLFIVAPYGAKGGAWLDLRFPIMAAFLLFAGLMPPALPRSVTLCASLAIAALFAVRVAKIAEVWYAHEGYVTSVRSVVAQVPPGSRVVIARADPQMHPRWWHEVPPGRRLVGFGSVNDHLAVLLLAERHAFSPLLFSSPTQQPIRVLEPYRELSVPSGYSPTTRCWRLPILVARM